MLLQFCGKELFLLPIWYYKEKKSIEQAKLKEVKNRPTYLFLKEKSKEQDIKLVWPYTYLKLKCTWLFASLFTT